jgi:hypothetical protein
MGNYSKKMRSTENEVELENESDSSLMEIPISSYLLNDQEYLRLRQTHPNVDESRHMTMVVSQSFGRTYEKMWTECLMCEAMSIDTRSMKIGGQTYFDFISEIMRCNYHDVEVRASYKRKMVEWTRSLSLHLDEA